MGLSPLPQELFAAWDITGPVELHPVLHGINNESYQAVTPGVPYLLRIYQNTADPDRVGYEHALLAQLGTRSLPFTVSVPLVTGSGHSLVPTSDGRLAALFPFLPGRHGAEDDETICRLGGAALAALDHALAAIDLPVPPAVFPPFGDLTRIHPLIPDPLAMTAQLPAPPSDRAIVACLIEGLAERVATLYATLPRQVVHRGFDGTDLLMDGGRVIAILDFEFAAPDLRALDLAVALTQFTRILTEVGRRRAGAFVRAYMAAFPLTPAEMAALPDLMRLFRSVSLIAREGRRQQGRAGGRDVQGRAERLLHLDTWLQENAPWMEGLEKGW